MAVNQRVEVTRAFRVGGKDVGIGSVINIDMPSALELRTARKVSFVPNDTALVTKPLPTKERRSSRAAQTTIAELSAQVAALTALVEKQGQAVHRPSARVKEEKANA